MSAPHPRRYRPYRLVLWILYFTVALTFVGAIIVGGTSGMLRERRGDVEPGATFVDAPTCAADLGKLYTSLHNQLATAQNAGTPELDAARAAEWATLRSRLHGLGRRCGLEGSGGNPGPALTKAYEQVKALSRLLESAATRYREDVVPTDLATQRALREAGAAL